MKELLFSVTKKDLEITYFSGSGAGGQHRNRHKNCVRIKHTDSGVLVTGQEEKSLKQNLKTALKRLSEHPDFKSWVRIKSAESIEGKRKMERRKEDFIEQWMKKENLKIEYLSQVK